MFVLPFTICSPNKANRNVGRVPQCYIHRNIKFTAPVDSAQASCMPLKLFA